MRSSLPIKGEEIAFTPSPDFPQNPLSPPWERVRVRGKVPIIHPLAVPF